MPDTTDESHHDRLRELEEAAAFAERHAEQLSEQIVQVWQRLDLLTARLGQMESRLTEMHQSLAEQQDNPKADHQGEDDDTTEPGPAAESQLRAERPPHWDGRS